LSLASEGLTNSLRVMPPSNRNRLFGIGGEQSEADSFAALGVVDDSLIESAYGPQASLPSRKSSSRKPPGRLRKKLNTQPSPRQVMAAVG